jgi:hypothetical protein
MTSSFKVPPNLRRASEQQLRMKVNKLLKGGDGVIRGTLSQREKVCGKGNCKCTRGEKHSALYLVQRQGGQMRQLFVPAEWAGDVKQWVSNYQVAQQLLDELSDMYWAKIKQREI